MKVPISLERYLLRNNMGTETTKILASFFFKNCFLQIASPIFSTRIDLLIYRTGLGASSSLGPHGDKDFFPL